jgi:hypothetical protein
MRDLGAALGNGKRQVEENALSLRRLAAGSGEAPGAIAASNAAMLQSLTATIARMEAQAAASAAGQDAQVRAMGHQLLQVAGQVANMAGTAEEQAAAVERLGGQLADMEAGVLGKIDELRASVEASLVAILAQTRMLTRMLTHMAEDRDCPSTFTMVPQAQTHLQRLASPKNWLNQTLMLMLFCDCGCHSVPCGADGKGYEILQVRGQVQSFVAKYGPVIKVALFTIKLALAAGRALGLPLPFLPDAVASAGSLLQNELEHISALYDSVSEAVASEDGDLNAQLDSVLAKAVMTPSEAEAVQRATGPLYRDLKALLDSVSADRSMPLFKTVRGSDGSVGWVCQDHVARWRSS